LIFSPAARRASAAIQHDGGAEGNQVLRNIPQHAMSRILSSPRLSEI
jgi:hypothetical protein